MRPIEISLPYPPSVNRYWRRVRGRVLISKEGRAYRDAVRTAIRCRQLPEMTGTLDVQIDMHPPDNRKRDVDNILKALLDGMQNGGLYDDDYQIERLTVERMPPKKGHGMVHVTITQRETSE